MTSKNHFIPRMYLKNFTGCDGDFFVYRTLVSHPHVPEWEKVHHAAVGYHHHIYSALGSDGKKNDHLEARLAEIERAADASLQKAINDEKMTPLDWSRLAHFALSFDVRTPASFFQTLERWKEPQPFLHDSVSRSIERLSKGEARRDRARNLDRSNDSIPIRVRVKPSSEADKTPEVEVALLPGRALWHFSIQRALDHTIPLALDIQKWTVLKAPRGVSFVTSDRPLVKLNWYGDKRYDFGAGWGSSGSDLFLPLSPQHLLYTQIGKKTPMRGEVLDLSIFEMFQKIVVEHAFRNIYSATKNQAVPSLHPRRIDQNQFEKEKEYWRDWDQGQTDAEIEFRLAKIRSVCGPGRPAIFSIMRRA